MEWGGWGLTGSGSVSGNVPEAQSADDSSTHVSCSDPGRSNSLMSSASIPGRGSFPSTGCPFGWTPLSPLNLLRDLFLKGEFSSLVGSFPFEVSGQGGEGYAANDVSPADASGWPPGDVSPGVAFMGRPPGDVSPGGLPFSGWVGGVGSFSLGCGGPKYATISNSIYVDPVCDICRVARGRCRSCSRRRSVIPPRRGHQRLPAGAESERSSRRRPSRSFQCN